VKQIVADSLVSALTGVHPTAIVDDGAEIGTDVSIGPYCVLGPNVTIGDGARLGPHVVIERDTSIGEACRLHAGSVVGGDPQDLKYGGEATRLEVGARTVIRECATLNRGTGEGGVTRVGSDCLLMAYSHVAHDCVIGDHVVLSNAVEMAGHVRIEDWVVVGGLTAIHQFTRIGQHAFVGGATAVRKDIPPFVKASGDPASLYGLNSVGLQRRGFSLEVRSSLRRVYRLLFQSDLNVSHALAAAREQVESSPEVMHFLDFIEKSERGIAVQR
jgi:UDP-N-acetylglucosamine acyltransferase